MSFEKDYFWSEVLKLDGEWSILKYDSQEYRNDSLLGWDELIKEKVIKITNSNYPVRVSRFHFGIYFISKKGDKNTRLSTNITIAEQNNRFFAYLEDEDDFLPDYTCLDLKKLHNEELVRNIIKDALTNKEVLQQVDEWLRTCKFYESFSGIRTFRRLKKFILDGCNFESFLE